MRVVEDTAEWRAAVRGLVEERGIDSFRDRYREREYPHELYDAVVDRGWMAPSLLESYGGPGRSHAETVVAVEELARHGYDFAMPVLRSATGTLTLLDRGTEAQRDRLLPRVAGGTSDIQRSVLAAYLID